MKAIRLLEYGGQLAFYDVPTPTTAREEILRSTCLGYLVMSFQGSSNRLAVMLRHIRQVMLCSVPAGWEEEEGFLARTRRFLRQLQTIRESGDDLEQGRI